MKKIVLLIFFVSVFWPWGWAGEIELNELLAKSQARFEWNTLLNQGFFLKGNTIVSFSPGLPWILLNFDTKLSLEPIQDVKGRLLIPEATGQTILNLLQSEVATLAPYRVAAIVIDPGHGGRDSGARYVHNLNGKQVTVAEKDIVLACSLLLYEMLKKRFPDKKVVLTRRSDITLELEERPALANALHLADHEAIIYISLHANASLNKNAKGFEVWYLTASYRRNLLAANKDDSLSSEILPIMNSIQDEEYTRESIVLAREVLTELNAVIGKETENRGLKEGEWLVVRKAKMPSILIELGFVSNPLEAAKLMDKAYLQKLSLAIYNGVSSFVFKFEQVKAFKE